MISMMQPALKGTGIKNSILCYVNSCTNVLSGLTADVVIFPYTETDSVPCAQSIVPYLVVSSTVYT